MDASHKDGGSQHDIGRSADAAMERDRCSSSQDAIMVRFEPGDPENPYNWSTKKKAFIVGAGMLQVLNSTMGSAAPSTAVAEIGQAFDITSSQQLTLPISTFLMGYVVGPLVFGPLSETYGRRWIMISSFVAYIIWVMASALAPNFAALCIFRLFCGVAASTPIVVIGGLFADIFADSTTRGKAMAIFMACTTWGPCISPIISGFVAKVSWRWVFWVDLIVAGASLPIMASLPETYGPVLLRNRARLLRKKHPEKNYVARIELEPLKARDIITRVIFRPVSMIIHESIVSFTCIYLSLIYSIFYLYFEAYPLIFQGLYGLNAGEAGLAFLAIAVGSIGAYVIFDTYDGYLRRAQARKAPWSLKEEYRRLPLAVIGGPALSIGVFWLAWGSWPWVHPVVPALAGLPFGMGFLLIFMALINYCTDAYDIYAASALAATSTTRSIFGAVLPLAAEPMYKALGIHWATSLLGFASALMILIPVAFIRFGPYLRDHSKFSRELKALKEEERREDLNSLGTQRENEGEIDVEKQEERSTTGALHGDRESREAGDGEKEDRYDLAAGKETTA